MKTAPEADGSATPADNESAAAPAPERHHGDLRKGAYLRRRANYQMQASSLSNGQAGGMTEISDATTSRQRKPR